MRDIPIIFSATMVHALLAGRKTQTRRLASSQLYKAQPGDRVWVRESVRGIENEAGEGIIVYLADGATETVCVKGDNGSEFFTRWWNLTTYRSIDPNRDTGKILPPCGMPRWASRLTLVVEQMRVERLQDISEADAIAEGCPAQTPEELAGMEARGWFRDLWGSINGPGAWDANPWVVALTFTVHRTNIDKLEAREVAIG
ncbi:hypothetical protein D3869_01645 [Azospirillum brasilense]|uniref:ASCH domain-containing protein n=1 Tax=Azospirillum brasilense TaxID=192 RepID=A0A4D8R4I4_AZOBR|nr:hypothetical protein [Azospirillum brasilense]QCO14039.1 hypothetical protein D3869_01645 [Azospirillum brasilense]